MNHKKLKKNCPHGNWAVTCHVKLTHCHCWVASEKATVINLHLVIHPENWFTVMNPWTRTKTHIPTVMAIVLLATFSIPETRSPLPGPGAGGDDVHTWAVVCWESLFHAIKSCPRIYCFNGWMVGQLPVNRGGPLCEDLDQVIYLWIYKCSACLDYTGHSNSKNWFDSWFFLCVWIYVHGCWSCRPDSLWAKDFNSYFVCVHCFPTCWVFLPIWTFTCTYMYGHMTVNEDLYLLLLAKDFILAGFLHQTPVIQAKEKLRKFY